MQDYMPTYQKNLGAWGEAIAEKYLKSKGYDIVFRNYRKRIGEIDLVAQKKNRTFFIEVKTRTSHTFGFPEESIDRYKLAKLSSVIEAYLAENQLPAENIQLDCIIVEYNQSQRKVKIRHLKDIELDA